MYLRKLIIILAIFSAYLMLCRRFMESDLSDGGIMFSVARSIVSDFRLSLNKDSPPRSHRGPDGNIYSQYAILPSLLFLPAAAMDTYFGQRYGDICARATIAALAAMSCFLLFVLIKRQGVGESIASTATLMFAFSTSFIVYSRTLMSETLQSLCFLWFLLCYFENLRKASPGKYIIFGISAGVLMNTKILYSVSIMCTGVHLLYRMRKKARRIAPFIFYSGVGLGPFILLLLWYNKARWGSYFLTGYEHLFSKICENPLFGLWGLLFSPGKSLFLFNPPIILLVVAAHWLWKNQRHVLMPTIIAVIPPIIPISMFLDWSGDWSWGPRLIIYSLAPCIILISLWLEYVARRWTSYAARGTFIIIFAGGMCVQLLGMVFDPSSFIIMQRAVMSEWLGKPNRSGALSNEFFNIHGEKNGEFCGWCFEDMHGLQWLPPFQHIRGNYWLARHVIAGHSWEVAEKDAPWKKYTSLRIDVRGFYESVGKVDWLPLAIKEEKDLKAVVFCLYLFLGPLMMASFFFWFRYSFWKKEEKKN